jgi:hypothetical protein
MLFSQAGFHPFFIKREAIFKTITRSMMAARRPQTWLQPEPSLLELSMSITYDP